MQNSFPTHIARRTQRSPSAFTAWT